ncbi:MAG: formyltetrahydrofolate deformylase [Verrucomicrobiales bacterium]
MAEALNTDGPKTPRPEKKVVLVESADRPGLVHGITGAISRFGLNIVVNHEFVERVTRRFFMRTEYEGAAEDSQLIAEIRKVLPEDATIRISNLAPKQVVILVSKEHHCLADLLVRHAFGELNANVLAVISNHQVLESFTARFDIPFEFVSAEGMSREAHEAAIIKMIERYSPEFLVLAKYMRVLSSEFVARYPSRIINIHHSFLPAFVGARPYEQAYQRGVKVIGATAHFVTEELDQGPIIVQQVIPVNHTYTPRDLAQAGRDVEQMVLAGALKLAFEDRVFLAQNRTVIFE